jgi:flagellar basal-body rod protein FlgF
MIRGLYTSAWSMKAIQKKMDVVSNNIANINSNAFKKDVALFRSFPEYLTLSMEKSKGSQGIGTIQPGHDVDEVFIDFTEGRLEVTGEKYDLAIKGAPVSFFTVGNVNADGRIDIYYTRDGSFQISPNGELITKEGYLVMGEDGAIVLESGDFTVNEDGTVIQKGDIAGRLLIQNCTNPETLRKYGYSYLLATDETVFEEFSGSVVQGAIELSNVNPIREMVDMINVMRQYEANQRMILTQDRTLEKAVNDIGAV